MPKPKCLRCGNEMEFRFAFSKSGRKKHWVYCPKCHLKIPQER